MTEVNASILGLVDAIDRLAGASAIEDVVEVVRLTARKLIGADGIAVILREGETCHYVEEDALGPLWKGQHFPMIACVSGWAMIHKRTVTIPDVTHDERIVPELYSPTFVKSLAMVPVRSDDPIGAIGAYWQDVREPTATEVELLEALARAAATAIENVRLIRALSKALADAELARDELRHRVKNAFTAAQALASLSLPAEHAQTLSARLAALARAHELLDHKLATQEAITVHELLDAELEPYRDGVLERIQLDGPKLQLDGGTAVALGLAINELATNALKYGALSVANGTVSVNWREEDRHLILDWRESDGPEVKAHAIENFGSRLLRRLIEGQLRGTIRRELARAGATCTIEIPIGHRAATRPAAEPAVSKAGEPAPQSS